jgi:hypothetical protein
MREKEKNVLKSVQQQQLELIDQHAKMEPFHSPLPTKNSFSSIGEEQFNSNKSDTRTERNSNVHHCGNDKSTDNTQRHVPLGILHFRSQCTH